jgi:tocopherol O-methyltransferase
MFTNSDIAKHYEGCEEHYRYWWNLAKSKSMHYGYWDETTSSFHDAMMNINKVMSEKIGIGQLDHVLDAGCGVGGSSIWLAKNRNCHVTGITLSEKQRIQAEQYANTQGLSHKVDFRLEDFTNTSFPDRSFDVVWAIESVCHAEDKMLFLKEAYRLLKPGGRLIVADFFNRNGLEGPNKELMDKMAYGWAISSFTTIEAFEKVAKEINFKKISIEDASKAIRRSAWLLYLASFPGLLFTKLYAVFYNPSHLTKYNARTANIQYPALKKGLWKYQIFQAVRE